MTANDLLTSIAALAQGLADAGDLQSLRIVNRHLQRYASGHATYGNLDLDKDPRDFILEMRAELDDALYYLEAQQMKEERQCERLKDFARQNRLSYVVRADASPSTPELPTAAS